MPKNKQGRPPLPPGEARSEIIKVRVRHDEKEFLTKAAISSGRPSLSAWAREILLLEAAHIQRLLSR